MVKSKVNPKLTNTKHVNLSSYDDVESLENFTAQSFKEYCQAKMDGCDKHVDFINKQCVSAAENWSGRVVEIGSGNGKLLFNLEKKGLLKTGLGIEVSQSRHEFSQKFKKLVGSQLVTNVNQAVFALQPNSQSDLVVAVDVVLQLIAPLFESAEQDILNWCRRSLKPGGFLLLELWSFEHLLKQLALMEQALQVWEEFPETDPFEFCLAKIDLNESKDIVWEKTFLKRGSGEKSFFTNILRPYSEDAIVRRLQEAGFHNIEVFQSWRQEDDTAPGEYIVLAQNSESL